MSNFSALKTAVQQVIKQNGNEEITGAILQEILLSIINTLGDSAINNLETALQTETTNRTNADGTLQQNINSEATARGEADTALGNLIGAEETARENADTVLQGAITAINARLNEGYLYKGIATTTTNPSTPTGRLFYIATAAGTYTYFLDANSQPLVVTKGINILKYNGSWEVQQVVGIDETPTADSHNLVESGGVQNELALGAVYDISAKNPTAGPNNDGKFESLSALLSDANLNTLIPTDYRKGGMSVKFVCTSDNKYVQYRLMADAWSTVVTDWQGVDEVPTAGSDNLVKSGGVENDFYKVNNSLIIIGKNKYNESARIDGKIINSDGTIGDNQYYHLLTNRIRIFADKTLFVSANGDNFGTVKYHYYDANGMPIGDLVTPTVSQSGTIYSFSIPYISNAYCVIINCTHSMSGAAMQVEFGNARTSYESYQEQNRFDILAEDVEQNKDDIISLNDDISTINSKLDSELIVVGKNKYNESARIDGKLISSDGSITDNQYYHLLSNKIYLSPGEQFFVSAVGSNFGTVYYHYYDDNDNPVGSRETATVTQGDNTYSFVVPYYSGASYVLINTSNSMVGAQMQVEFGDKRTTYEAYTRVSRLNLMEAEIAQNSSDIEELKKSDISLTNVLKGVEIPEGTPVALKKAIKRIWFTCKTAGNIEKVLNNSDNIEDVTVATVLTYASARTIILKNGENIIFSFYAGASGSGRENVGCALASAYVTRWGIDGYTYKPTIYIDIDWSELTVGTTYNSDILLTLADLNRVEPTDAKLSDSTEIISFSTWKGKKIVCFGDSITEITDTTNALHYSDYIAMYTGGILINVGVGGSQLRQRKAPTMTPTENSDAYAALDIINMVKAACNLTFAGDNTYRDLAMTAAEWLRDNNNDDNVAQVQRIIDTDWSTVDAITIFGGTNDWGASESGDKLGTTGSSDINYTLGAVNEIIRLITTTYPNIKVYWFTPIVRWENWSASPRQDSDWGDVLQYGGHTLREYSAAIQTEVGLNHIPICDLYNTLGWTKYNCGNYWDDGVHPRLYAGTTSLAKKIMSFIVANRSF